MNTAGVIRIFLVVDMVAMALLALFYLRERRMRWVDYCCWGFLALFVPLMGPFLVIVNRPGEWHPDPFPSVYLRWRVRQSVVQIFQQSAHTIRSSFQFIQGAARSEARRRSRRKSRPTYPKRKG